MTSRATRWIALLLTVAALAGTVSACGTVPTAPESAASADDLNAGETQIAVVDRGRHTDIVLAAEDLTGPAASLRLAFPGVKFLVFGFGDRAYLMSRSVSFSQTVAALFPGPGVILVTALSATPQEAFSDDHVVVLRLSCTRLKTLTAFVQAALVVQADGSLQRLGDGPYPGSAFYGTPTTYDLLYDCNRWTAEALQNGGFAIQPRGVIIASQLMTQIDTVAARQKPLAASEISRSPCSS
jgi:uncharacterized protein (TIGR02117 family)